MSKFDFGTSPTRDSRGGFNDNRPAAMLMVAVIVLPLFLINFRWQYWCPPPGGGNPGGSSSSLIPDQKSLRVMVD